MNDPATPKVTPGVWISLTTGIVGLLAAFGLDIPADAQDAMVQVVTALVLIIPAAEAYVRNGRARYFAAKVQADAAIEARTLEIVKDAS